ncbi:MAG: CoA-disulfide reductase [Candidatus Marinimicrobia bacterium]|nr:CoA-disulfide reductase [Candidatus Neomarinimicrobiota bacterium]
MKKKYVIIGGDAAGMSAASKIRRLEPESEMIVFEKGQHISFAACGIPYWISGVIESMSKLEVLTPEDARKKRGIDIRVGHEVLKIDTEKNSVLVRDLSTGEDFSQDYDSLLIATGARATIPPIPGVEKQGVFTLRNLDDGQKIIDFLDAGSIKHATIIGAGYIGLEMAETFRHRGIDVTMIEMQDQIAPTFDKDTLEQVTSHIIEKGVALHLETRVSAIENSVSGLTVMSSGGNIETDIVIVSTGVRPNSELASETGIGVGKSGAIVIDEHMRTTVENVYAAGDCAEHLHRVLNQPVWIPLAPAANRGGRIAGENMAGQSTVFPGILGTAAVKVFDYIIAQTGLTEKQAASTDYSTDMETTTITGGSRAHYYPGSVPLTVKLVVQRSTKRLLGAQIIGKQDVAKRLDVLATAITAKMTVADIGMLDLTYAPPIAPVYDPIHIAANVANK